MCVCSAEPIIKFLFPEKLSACVYVGPRLCVCCGYLLSGHACEPDRFVGLGVLSSVGVCATVRVPDIVVCASQ